MKAARPFVLQYLAILAIALTNLGFGLTIFGFAWTIVGCSPATVHIVSADSAAFQQLLNVEMAAESRRPAHLMKRYVRGDLSRKVGILDDDKLPEPYTQNEEDAVWPSNYHLGYAAA